MNGYYVNMSMPNDASYLGEWAYDDHAHRIGFYLTPSFSMIAFVAALEPLRLANLLSGKPICSWDTMSHETGMVNATNSAAINIAQMVDDVPTRETIFGCGGVEVRRSQEQTFLGV